MTINTFFPQSLVLENQHVKLKPMETSDFEPLFHAANFPEVHQWLKSYRFQCRETSDNWFSQALEAERNGQQVPFVTIDQHTNAVAGSTRFLSFNHASRTLEIGFTFITPKFQRSHINTSAKYLMLKQAFEQWGAIRVQIITHEKNQKSRNAISRLGASFEGILRNQKILNDGSYRNTAVYSIIECQWPQVKQALERKIGQNYDQ